MTYNICHRVPFYNSGKVTFFCKQTRILHKHCNYNTKKVMTLKLEEFATCCRCCLSTTVKTQPLFGLSLGEMLQSVISLEVNETDQYPQQICTRCVMKLSSTFNFCQMVKTSYQTLTGILEKSIEPLNVNIPVSNKSEDCHEDVKPMLPSHEEVETVSNTVPDNLCFEFEDSSKCVIKKEEEDISTEYQNVQEYGREETNEELFVCSHCPKQFQYKREMEIHLRQDHKVPCAECGKIISVLGMPRHLQTHRNRIKSYVCQRCGRPFADSSNLSKHMKIHTDELRNPNNKVHLCPYCGKQFRWRTSLCRHRRIHSKNLLICVVCFKKFGDQYTMKIHMASHKSTKPFTCDTCNRGFTQLCNLNKHKQTHTAEKPHKCPHCNRGFRQKYVMLLHVRKHTGEKPYICQKCQKCFAWKNSLLAHMRVHNRAAKSTVQNNDVEENNDSKQLLNITFLCMRCNEKFSSHELYEEHLKVHKDESSCVLPV